MKLAFSSNAYMHFSIEDAIRKIAELGYPGIEVLADVPHAWPANLLEERKQSIRDSLRQYKLEIANINAFMMNAVADPRQPYWHPGWTDPDPHYRAIRREHTKRALRLASEIGGKNITTEPGGLLTDDQTWEEAAKIFYEEFMPCVDLAAELEVMLLIEPEPGLMIETFQQYEEFAGRIDSPWVGLNFDIGHAFCVGQDPEKWVGKMATHTKHYHIEDIADTRIHQHLIPGHGAIDLATTLKEIDATGYEGWVTVELYPYIDEPDGAASSAKEYLGKLMDQIGIRGG